MGWGSSKIRMFFSSNPDQQRGSGFDAGSDRNLRPVLVSSTFRTHDEAVALANNTAYGLAASVWSENINLALDVAPRLKAGVVWITCTNQFDASSGFGGYRESGFGREGGMKACSNT